MNGIDLIRDDSGNLIKVRITNTKSFAEIYMFGATLTSWIVEGQERLFLSEKAILDGTKAIRGGIPIVFPQFNTKLTTDLPSHGFARISNWKWGGINVNTPDKKEVSFILTDKEVDKKYLEIWPHQFKLVYTVLLEGKSLKTTIKIKNTGNEPWLFNTLLHTYFNVDDINEANVQGLINCNYIDTSPEGNGEKNIESRQKVVFQKEVDSIYYDVNQKSFRLHTGFKNDIIAEKCTLPDVVVWNPWIEKSSKMADFGVESYPNMFCFEVGSVYQPIELDVDAVYEGGQVLTVV